MPHTSLLLQECAKSRCKAPTVEGSICFERVVDASVCALTKVAVGPVAAGLEVDGLECAVDAERVTGSDLAEHFRGDEGGGDGRE